MLNWRNSQDLFQYPFEKACKAVSCHLAINNTIVTVTPKFLSVQTKMHYICKPVSNLVALL